jgi:Fur family ferric uptake transcriptional regulator
MSQKSISFNQLKSLLHASGRRMTPQRALVLSVLRESGGHLDAKRIWRLAREHDRRLNLATIYRTLDVLKEIGLVDQRYFARDHKREIYELARKPEHYHFSCLGCGQVFEFETAHMLHVGRELVEQYGARLTNACVCFEGFCAECTDEVVMMEGV